MWKDVTPLNSSHSNKTFHQGFDFLFQSNHHINSEIKSSQTTLLEHSANKAGNLKQPTRADVLPLCSVLVIRLLLVHVF